MKFLNFQKTYKKKKFLSGENWTTSCPLMEKVTSNSFNSHKILSTNQIRDKKFIVYFNYVISFHSFILHGLHKKGGTVRRGITTVLDLFQNQTNLKKEEGD